MNPVGGDSLDDLFGLGSAPLSGDPLGDIRNLRKVTRVVANGRVYDSQKLWQSVGFR